MAKAKKATDVEFNDLQERFGYLLRRAYQVMRSSLENSPDNKFGLTSTQHAVLTITSGEEEIDQIGIARMLDLDRTTTGLAIKNLEKNGLVTRKRSRKDRRSLIIRPTAKAKRNMEAIQLWASKAHESNASKLTKAEQATLRRLLKKLTA